MEESAFKWTKSMFSPFKHQYCQGSVEMLYFLCSNDSSPLFSLYPPGSKNNSPYSFGEMLCKARKESISVHLIHHSSSNGMYKSSPACRHHQEIRFISPQYPIFSDKKKAVSTALRTSRQFMSFLQALLFTFVKEDHIILCFVVQKLFSGTIEDH
ncbi:hypothetical protein AVEN_27255-1 [Araneus ventricosus]|uniref:Uncharacterized protein n=1 Tax=Araneus ventricosus TaxID=182803 RepID=A0A4Y2CBH8_ARAVE|nr:hypothetical protein AVEN_27255-1 [Araneus ventricosus]